VSASCDNVPGLIVPPGRLADKPVDLHGHGRTALGDRAISLIDIGDDMAVILGALATAT
jgi:hypothetical protein